MQPQISHHLVNWQEGMKLSYRHFEQLENVFNDLIRDSRALTLNDNNYGLLPLKGQLNPTFQLLDGRAVLSACNGITRGGSRVEILPERNTPIEVILPEGIEEQIYDLAIEIDIFQKGDLIGKVDNNETPRRFPFKLPKFHLTVEPKNDINSSEYYHKKLLVGRLFFKNGNWTKLTDYIPPSAQIGSTNELSSKFDIIKEKVNDIWKNSNEVLEIIQRQESKDQITEIVKGLTISIVECLLPWRTAYRYQLKSTSPILLFSLFQQVAGKVKLYLENLEGGNIKSENEGSLTQLAFFFQFLKKTPYNFDNNLLLENLKIFHLLEYKHLNIGDFIPKINDLLNLLHPLYKNLATQSKITHGDVFIPWKEKTKEKSTNSSFSNWK